MECSRSFLPEDLCWEIAEEGEADLGVPCPPEEILRAYKSGRLQQDEQRRLEWHLAHSREARRRLAALAEVELPQPPPVLRERVLARPFQPRHAMASAGGAVTADRLAPAPQILLVKP